MSNEYKTFNADEILQLTLNYERHLYIYINKTVFSSRKRKDQSSKLKSRQTNTYQCHVRTYATCFTVQPLKVKLLEATTIYKIRAFFVLGMC
jgi:hypothetical protein